PQLPAGGAGGAPRTAAEREVAEVFAEILELASAGPDDDFFLLGGHSLLAAKAAARLTRRLGVEVPVTTLFTHSTVAALAAATGDLRAGSTPPAPRPAGTPPPLSPAQERMWFLYRLDPQDASYNVYLARRLRGPLDPDRLADALTRVAARHEALRTRFPEVDGTPVAVVEPPAPVPVERLDVSGLPPAERQAEATRLVTARVNAPMDLMAAPPLRATLIRLDDGDHVLCVVFHHIIGDGWSQNVLLADLAACYEGRDLPGPVLQQGDVAHWHLARDAAGEGDAALAYWRERLAGLPALDLPTDRRRPDGVRPRGAFEQITLPAGTVDRLRELGRGTGTTLFMVLLAAYQALLGRQSGQHDLAIGTAVAGRDRVELEPVFGYLAGTLALRGDLSGDPSFTELLARTRSAVVDAFRHRDVPLEELHVRRSGEPAELFQSMLILHTQDEGAGSMDGLDVEIFHAGHTPVRFDLMVDAWPQDGGFGLTFGYDATLFDAGTVANLAALYVTLLENVAAEPGARLSRLLRVPGAGRDRLLHDRNDTALELPAVPSTVALFAERVAADA
ncbi:condensation domain-containing protein, partial [Sphaerisporangium rufum]|uniref:condensation domain-containing protein n=1 Tax=Sphaerisporangium rufum TaxID=1381558 RepID=UPI001EF3C3C7